MASRETGRLLEAWREAERASSAARIAAEHAQDAAEAASKAAKAARLAAEDASVTLDAADIATGHARDAYHEHEAEAHAQAGEESRPPSALGETG